MHPQRVLVWLDFLIFYVMFFASRFEDVDPETGIEMKQSFSKPFKDLYPVHIIENVDGIQGSCALFKQRKDVSKRVRSKSLTRLINLQEAFERFVELSLCMYSAKWLFSPHTAFMNNHDCSSENKIFKSECKNSFVKFHRFSQILCKNWMTQSVG